MEWRFKLGVGLVLIFVAANDFASAKQKARRRVTGPLKGVAFGRISESAPQSHFVVSGASGPVAGSKAADNAGEPAVQFQRRSDAKPPFGMAPKLVGPQAHQSGSIDPNSLSRGDVSSREFGSQASPDLSRIGFRPLASSPSPAYRFDPNADNGSAPE